MLVAFVRHGSPRTGWYHQPIVSVAADLDRHRYISLSTFRRNGAEVATPVWFAGDGEKLYVFTLGDSGKVKRLRHTAKARVAPSDSRGRVQGAARAATARLIAEPAVIDRAHGALRAKYGWQMRVADLFSGLTGRARRRVYIAIDVE
jgi:PPOX class probable F420-dependent enzyme